MRRRLLSAGLALLVLTGLFLVLPVFSAPRPQPVPVKTAAQEVPMGSVATPAPAATVRPGPAQAVPGVLPTAPTLTVTKKNVKAFSMVGVTWRFDPAISGTVVRVRVQKKAGTWGSWTQVGIEDGIPNADAKSGHTQRGGTAPLWTGPSTSVQAELTTRSGARPTDVQLDLIDPGTSAADSALGAPAIRDTAHAATAMPPVFSRAQWGADESIRTWAPQYAGTIKAATIHHTADSNDYTADQVPALMRSIYRYHATVLGWGDIGYNVVVDKFGRMWEGRYGGLASTVIGAHAGGFNTYTFGVSMLGNYDVVDVPGPVIAAVSSIISWKFALYGVNPRGTTVLTSGGGGTDKYAPGVKVTLPTIFAHRDVGATICPGQYAYARMNQIRDRVAGVFVDLTKISARYDSDPALQTLLGAQTTAPTFTPDLAGGYAHYQNGSLYYSNATGVRVVRGAIRDYWASLGWEQGVLRYPTSDTTTTSDGGQYQTFQGGSVYWTAATGARGLYGPVEAMWKSTGAATGPLGYPTQSVSTTADGAGQYARFQKGSIYWTPATGARVMLGAVETLWRSTGAEKGLLGYPVQSVSTTADKVGQFARFQNGSIYWTPGTGARAMLGPVETLWKSGGAEAGPLGYPTQSVSTTSDKAGQYATFQKGSIYWTPDTGAQALGTAVRDSWVTQGAATGPLGYPTSGSKTAVDGTSQYAHFEGGSLYVTSSGTKTLTGPVRDLWVTDGADAGALGAPTSSSTPAPDGVGEVATFANGSIYWSPDTGARAMVGDIDTRYQAHGAEQGALGYPTTSVTPTADGAGRVAQLQNGSIYWSAATGAHVVAGPIRTKWNSTGAERGALGYPSSDVAATADGAGQFARFQKGSIFWSPTTPASVLLGPIETTWNAMSAEQGVLGYPTQSVSTMPDGKGQYGRFEHGTIYWSAATGARALMGPVETFWKSTGAATGPLGYPTQSVSTAADGAGQYARFEHGSIYWSQATGARAVLGPVETLWTSTGAERGPLGYPTQSVSTAADGKGQYARFEHGSIYWSAATGARALLGPIADRYAALGAERGALGYPTQSVSTSTAGAGQYAKFTGGSIYWSTATGARVVSGAFLTAYGTAGYERGVLGYPIGESYAVSGGSWQKFQHGYISYSNALRKATVVHQ